MLHDCVVLAVEGTHASGKTTLTHALAAHYRERGVRVACVDEPARDGGGFDLEAGVDLFAAHLCDQLRAARRHTMIIVDKTIANVLAYARLVLPTPPQARQEAAFAALDAFSRAWAHVYDAVFYCCDRFGQQRPENPYQAAVFGLQPAADRVVRHACAVAGQRVIDIPPGMTTADRVRWVADRAAVLGLGPAAGAAASRGRQGEHRERNVAG